MQHAALQTTLADLLVSRGLLTREQLDHARAADPDLGTAVLASRTIDGRTYNRLLEEVAGVPCLDPTLITVTTEFMDHIAPLIPRDFAVRHALFPIRHAATTVHVVLANPLDEGLVRRLHAVTGSRIRVYGCHRPGIIEAIRRFYPTAPVEGTRALRPTSSTESAGRLSVEGALGAAVQLVNGHQEMLEGVRDGLGWLAHQAPVVLLVREILQAVLELGTSDVHVEPLADALRVRVRKDGVLHTRWTFPATLKAPVVHRLKLMAGLADAPAGLPRDGRIDYPLFDDRELDIRVSTLPSVYGDKVVLRLLDRAHIKLSFDQLGFDLEALAALERAVARPNGMILITGPTGSGKTSTLYAALSCLNSDERNILTVEDPIEYQLRGATQVQIRPDASLTFATALRAFLRQDPDVIMVGEIRDGETADIAVKAALTGHLVLSTLHTNDTVGSVSRLLSMGVESFLVASALVLVEAQRLIRILCPACREPRAVTPDTLKGMGLEPERFRGATLYRAVGCSTCRETGYQGRLAIVEVLEVGEAIRESVQHRASAPTLLEQARQLGLVTLREKAIRRVLEGATTLEEVQRVTVAEEVMTA